MLPMSQKLEIIGHRSNIVGAVVPVSFFLRQYPLQSILLYTVSHHMTTDCKYATLMQYDSEIESVDYCSCMMYNKLP